MKTENQKHTPGKWVQYAKHERSPYLEKDDNYRSIEAGKGFFNGVGNFCITGCVSEADAELMASAPELKQRITDMEMVISNFITHVEENRGNYFPEELKKLRDLVAVERPYYPPVTYHDNWSGKEMTTEKD